MDTAKTGQLIASVRKSKNMTQQDIAEKLHITSKAVSKWERGLSFPSVDILENLAKVLDLSVVEILAGEKIQLPDIIEKADDVSIQVMTKERKMRRRMIIACTCALVMFAVLILSLWSPAIFQRGNPIPYLLAATRISDDVPYVRVSSEGNEYVYISKRGECPELFEYIKINWAVDFEEQLGGAYVFTNGSSRLIISSEIYWRNYTVWEVPNSTLAISQTTGSE